MLIKVSVWKLKTKQNKKKKSIMYRIYEALQLSILPFLTTGIFLITTVTLIIVDYFKKSSMKKDKNS